ncbi:MAG: hypothetical protein OEL57_11690 [Trichlorobacter sp.]|uniref:hypothetical protein n=1 Tax=Trichlorobacter sp. TaxID=2911007 RepID=UPI002568C7E7|nr:hypothetical protein [Trichlorobacter sp.]MDK9718549.1 hypothetical protein [Trichlorobacter sp.]
MKISSLAGSVLAVLLWQNASVCIATDTPIQAHPPAVVFVAPEEGGPRNWAVSAASKKPVKLFEKQSISSKVLKKYHSGAILDNLGCQSIKETVWCDVQQFGGGPRGYVQASFLKPAASPNGAVAWGPDNSATRAGEGRFDATGIMPCAFSPGQPMAQCEYGVARAGGGYATVVVKRPDGRTRTIFFRMGKAIGADTSQADGYPPFKVRRKNELNLISIGKERYEIPDAAPLGG